MAKMTKSEMDAFKKKNFDLTKKVTKVQLDKLRKEGTPAKAIAKYKNDPAMREALNRFYGKDRVGSVAADPKRPSLPPGKGPGNTRPKLPMGKGPGNTRPKGPNSTTKTPKPPKPSASATPSRFGPSVTNRPGPKPDNRPGPSASNRPGPKPGNRPGPSASNRPGPKPSNRPGPKPSDRPGPKRGSQ